MKRAHLVKYEIFILLVVYFLFHLGLYIYFPSLIWDEAAYLANAKSFFIGSNYNESFRSPLLSLLIALVWLITGEQVIIAKIISILFTLGCVYLTYIIGKAYFNKKSIFLSVLFSIAPLMLYWGNKVYTDIPSLFFILLSFYLIQKKKVFFSGISLGLSFLIRYSASLFGLSALIFLIFKKKYKESIIFILGTLILLSPWLIHNQIEHKNPIYGALIYVRNVGGWTDPFKEPAYFQIINLISVLGPLLIFLPFGIKSFLKKNDGLLTFIHISIFLIVFTFFFNLKLVRYYIMILPFLYLLVYEGFWVLRVKMKSHITLDLLIILSCFILVLPIFPQYYTDNVRWQTIEQSVMYLKENTNQNDLIISNFWPYFGYFINAEAMSTWDDVDYLVRTYYPRYVVYHDKFGLEVKINETWMPKRIFSNRLGTISIYEVS